MAFDRKKFEESCAESAARALEALHDASDEIVKEAAESFSGGLRARDFHDLKNIWAAISNIKTSLAMTEGGVALRKIMR